MMVLRICISALVTLSVVSQANAFSPDTIDFSKFFKGYEATFVLLNGSTGEETVWNEAQADIEYPAVSTFKIFNSMAAIDAGAVADENEVLKWDGKRRMPVYWNKDHNMRTAMKKSVVWFYQEMARRIGSERMGEYLHKAGYGNEDMSGGLTEFWLNASLRISAREQVDFLRRIYSNRVPFSQRAVDILKDILVVDRTDTYVLSGKTGTGVYKDEGRIGWFVGRIEHKGNEYFFALNIRDAKKASGQKAKAIAIDILRAEGLMG